MAQTDTDAHQRMSEKRNAGYEKKQARATLEKGLVIVNTGTGKGKSSAAFGMTLRAVGHGMKVGVVQFIKGAMDTAERNVLDTFDNVEFHAVGKGFTWKTQNLEEDVATANQGWAIAERMILDPSYDFVVLDELNVVLKYKYLSLEQVLEALPKRQPMQHVVITGRHAAQELIDAADLVTEMRPIRHPYKEQGVKAQKGVEF